MNDNSREAEEKKNSKGSYVGAFILLHVLMLFYSLSSICAKLASNAGFPSAKFIILYGVVLCIMFVYAILWQQVLKKLPLTTAYANKAVTIIWGLIWGTVVFKENVTIKQIIASFIIIIGVGLVVTCKDE